MTDASRAPAAPSAAGSEDLAVEFLAHRPRLMALAYRLLGSAWDAEDVVAEAMVRWLRVDRATVREPAAFLTTVVTRLALDQLRSARAAREQYVGPWLPEPVVTGIAATPAAGSAVRAASGPLELLERREAASLATLRMMEVLTPPERAVLVLHDAFDVPHEEIAGILGISVESSRQHLHRARGRLRTAAPDADKRFAPDPEAHATLFQRFLAALDGGDMDALQDLLAADAVAFSDGGGKVRAARHPLVGAERIARFYAGLRQRLPLREAQPLEVNGRPGALLRLGHQELVLAVEVRDGRIVELHSVLNPDKLRFLRRQLGLAVGSGGAEPQPGSTDEVSC